MDKAIKSAIAVITSFVMLGIATYLTFSAFHHPPATPPLVLIQPSPTPSPAGLFTPNGDFVFKNPNYNPNYVLSH
jgi:hypothetical protein